jgi:hypothetical protein
MAASDEFGKFGKKSLDSPARFHDQRPRDGSASHYKDVDLVAARLEVLRRNNVLNFDLEKRPSIDKSQVEMLARRLAPNMARQRQAAEKADAQSRSDPSPSPLSEDEKRQRFTEWEAQKRETLQAKQLDAKRALHHSQAHQREVLEAQLRLHHDSRREDVARLAAIEARQRQGSFLSRGLDKLRGVEQQKSDLQMNIVSAENRIRETQSGLDRQSAAISSLQHAQQREMQTLNHQIQKGIEAGYEIPPERPPRESSRNRGDEGRER